MKNSIIKKSVLSTVALLGLMAMTSSYAQGTAAGTILNNFSKSFYIMEKKISSFFSSSDKTKYKVHSEAMGKDFSDQQKLLETITRNAQDTLATLAYDVADYARQIFSAVYGVIKKYEGKDAKEANNFKVDMDRVFNPETAFKNIVTKLETLKKTAVAENHNELVAQITTIITMIERKKTEWKNKSDLSLGMGLITRMSC